MSRVRVGARARRRILAGGKLAVGRASESLAGWRAVVAEVRARAGGRCEVHRNHPGTEPHHVVPRSAGGEDTLENVVLLCHRAHRAVSAPFRSGRLVMTRERDGVRWEIIVKPNKWADDASGYSAGFGFIRTAVPGGATKIMRKSRAGMTYEKVSIDVWCVWWVLVTIVIVGAIFVVVWLVQSPLSPLYEPPSYRAVLTTGETVWWSERHCIWHDWWGRPRVVETPPEWLAWARACAERRDSRLGIIRLERL